MSEARFTKGQWFIEKDTNWNDDCWAISVKRDNDDLIHHCFAEVVYKMGHEESNPEFEANAHLISCAPEMYEMLEDTAGRLFQSSDKYCRAHGIYIINLLAKTRGEYDK